MSRRPRPVSAPEEVEWAQADIASGVGLSAAVDGVAAIIHSASDARSAEDVDVEGTRHLVEAAGSAGVTHLVYISIVGIDEIDFGYYQKKLVAERIIESSGLAHSILRATQFHSLVNSMISAAARLPLIMPLPTDFKFQSVAEAEVVEQLVRCLDDGARGRLSDFGGPEVLSLGEMAKIWMEVQHVRRWMIRLPIPGSVAAAFRAGKNTAPLGARGSTTWHDWLMARATRLKLASGPRIIKEKR